MSKEITDKVLIQKENLINEITQYEKDFLNSVSETNLSNPFRIKDCVRISRAISQCKELLKHIESLLEKYGVE
jgi:hypothetical protein